MLEINKSATHVADLIIKQTNNNNNIAVVQHQKPVQLHFMQLFMQNSAGGKNGGKN